MSVICGRGEGWGEFWGEGVEEPVEMRRKNGGEGREKMGGAHFEDFEVCAAEGAEDCRHCSRGGDVV